MGVPLTLPQKVARAALVIGLVAASWTLIVLVAEQLI